MLMLMRLLLDPTAVDGGTAAHDKEQAPPPPAMRSIPATEHDELLGKLAEYEEYKRTQAAELAKKEHDRLRALAAKGQADDALSQQNEAWERKYGEATTRYEQLDAEILREKRDGVLLAAIGGRTLAGETPEDREAGQADLMRLLESDFEAVRENGKVVVREKTTRRPAAEALKERLDGRRYARYFASKGGGAPPPPTGDDADEALAKNVAAWKARQLGAGVGLRAIR